MVRRRMVISTMKYRSNYVIYTMRDTAILIGGLLAALLALEAARFIIFRHIEFMPISWEQTK